MRRRPDRLQLLPQPALPEVPGQRRATLARRAQADLLPVEYYHVVFTLPAPIADIAYQNKAVVYGLLFDVAAETLLTIAADAKHLGARIGATLVLHTWGSALTHHPHVHGIVPGGGLAPDGKDLDRLQARLLPVGAGAVATVPTALPRRTAAGASSRQAAVLRRARALADAQAFALAGAAAQVRVGGLRQAAVRRTPGRAGVPVALHAPGGDLQQPAARAGRARRDLPLEGLPRQGRPGQDAAQDDDVGRGRVHASLPAARAAWRLPPHSPLRAAGQRRPQRQPRPRTARCCRSPSPAVQPEHDELDRPRRPSFVCAHCGHAMVILQTFTRGRSIRAPPHTRLPHDRNRSSMRNAGQILRSSPPAADCLLALDAAAPLQAA